MKKFDKFLEAEFFEGVIDWYSSNKDIRLTGFYCESPNCDTLSLQDRARKTGMRVADVAIVVAEAMGISPTSLFGRAYMCMQNHKEDQRKSNASSSMAGSKTSCSPKELGWDGRERLTYLRVGENSNTFFEFIPMNIQGVTTHFTCLEVNVIKGSNGNIVGAVCRYLSDDGHEKWIPASVREMTCFSNPYNINGVYKRLVLGHLPKLVRFLNEHLIEQFRTASIVFPLDFNASVALNKIARADEDCVVTGCWCEENQWDDCDWKVFDNRKVFLLPHASKASFLMAEKLMEKLEDHVRDVRVFLFPTADEGFEDDLDSADPFDCHLASKAFKLSGTDSDSLDSIRQNRPLTKDAFKHELKKMGLFVDKITEEVGFEAEDSIDRDALNSKSESESTVLTLDKFVTPEDITGIIGDTDSGKGYVAYTYSVAMACGFDIFGMKVGHKKKVLYFDAETSSTRIDSKIERIRIAYNGSEDLCDKNMKRVSLLGENVDITTPTGRGFIEKRIEHHRPSCVVFDNLLTMAKGVWNSEAKLREMVDWFRALASKYAVAIIYCHHTGKDGTALGSSTLIDMTQNLIEMKNRLHLYKEKPALQPVYKNKPGCLCEIKFTKTKEFPSLLNQSKIMYLDYRQDTPMLGNKWVEVGSEEDTQDSFSVEAKNSVLTLYRKLIEDDLAEKPIGKPRTPKHKQQFILWYATERYAKDNIGWFERVDVDGLYESSQEDKRNMLKAMVDRGWLYENKEAKAKRFRLKA